MSALREVLATFDIRIAGLGQLRAAEQGIRSFTSLLRGLGAATGIALAARAVQQMVVGTIEAASQLRNTASELNVTTDELQRYEFAAEASGVKTHDFALAMRYLERSAGNVALGVKGSQRAFSNLGIQALDSKGKVRPLWDLLGDLADKMQAHPERAVAMAMQVLGRGGAALVPVLKQGRKGLGELQKAFEATGGGINRDFLENSKKAQLQLAQWKYGLLTVKSAVVGALLPALTWLTDHFLQVARGTEWTRTHTFALTTALMALGGAAVVFGILRVVRTVTALGEALGITLGEGLLMLLPVLLAVGLLYLAFDDIYTLVNGGDSVIGRWLDGTYGPGSAKKFVEDVKRAIHAMKEAMDPIEQLASTVGAGLLKAFSASLPVLIRAVGIAILGVAAGVDILVSGLSQLTSVLGSVMAAISGDNKRADALKADAEKTGADFLNRFGKYGDLMATLFGFQSPKGDGPQKGTTPTPGLINSQGSLNLPPPPAPPAPSAPTSITVEQNFSNSPGDPKAVKDAARQGVQTALRNRRASHDDSLAAVAR